MKRARSAERNKENAAHTVFEHLPGICDDVFLAHIAPRLGYKDLERLFSCSRGLTRRARRDGYALLRGAWRRESTQWPDHPRPPVAFPRVGQAFLVYAPNCEAHGALAWYVGGAGSPHLHAALWLQEDRVAATVLAGSHIYPVSPFVFQPLALLPPS